MARICDLTGAKTTFGKSWTRTRGFINGKYHRKFLVNLQYHKYYFPTIDKTYTLRVSCKAMRTVKKYDGIENFILSNSRTLVLTPKLNKTKRDLRRAMFRLTNDSVQQV